MYRYLLSLILLWCLSCNGGHAHQYEELSVTLKPDQQLVLIDVALALVESGLKPVPSVSEEVSLGGLSQLVEDTFTSADAGVIAQIEDAVVRSALQQAFEPLFYLGFLDHLSLLAHHYDDKEDETQMAAAVQASLEVLERVLSGSDQ